MKFLFVAFLFFILFVFLFGFSILRMFVRLLFGSKPQQPGPQRSQSGRKSTTKQKETTTPSKQKIFTREEGEYVEYEEVKD